MKQLTLFSRAAGAVLMLAFLASPVRSQKTIIHAGHLIDGISDAPRERVSIIIENGRISDVRSGFVKVGKTDKLIDLSQKWVMPGFIDSHVHMSGQLEKGGYIKRFQLYPADVALIATKYLKRTLMAGFTTVRDVGADDFVNVSLRNAVNRGDIIGPRMFVSAKSLGVLGGHADPTNGYREDILPVPDETKGVVAGVESARRATLLAIKRGADLIKITATAGVLSLASVGQVPQFTEEEIRMVVETARDFGRKVAAHAHGAEGMKRAIRAGVASIEHGTYMDDEAMDLMIKHGCYMVPTIIAGVSVADSAKIPGFFHPFVVKKALTIGPVIRKTFAKAYKRGVPIAFGTDAGVFAHGKNALEFQYMVESGMPPMEAIKAATYHAAKLLGKLDDFGTIEKGKRADIIAVNESPLKNIKTLQHMKFVMKDGVVYRNE